MIDNLIVRTSIFVFSREIQTIVLKCIASMADKYKQIFEPYLKSFYVHSSDSSLVKQYKLEILTTLGNASNISTILREFQVRQRNFIRWIFQRKNLLGLDLCSKSR